MFVSFPFNPSCCYFCQFIFLKNSMSLLGILLGFTTLDKSYLYKHLYSNIFFPLSFCWDGCRTVVLNPFVLLKLYCFTERGCLRSLWELNHFKGSYQKGSTLESSQRLEVREGKASWVNQNYGVWGFYHMKLVRLDKFFSWQNRKLPQMEKKKRLPCYHLPVSFECCDSDVQTELKVCWNSKNV